jgi:hypothetical protein
VPDWNQACHKVNWLLKSRRLRVILIVFQGEKMLNKPVVSFGNGGHSPSKVAEHLKQQSRQEGAKPATKKVVSFGNGGHSPSKVSEHLKQAKRAKQQ